MIAQILIKDTVPPLLSSDSGDRALAWMEQFGLRYLPVIENGRFLGIISESSLLVLKDRSGAISTLDLPLDRACIYSHQHIYDALKFATGHRYPVVPVLDEEDQYAGLITIWDLLECIADVNAVNAEGGIIQLEIERRDYMLSEIAQLVEAHDASIISVSAVPAADHLKTEVTIKVNRVDLTRILAALTRYNYKITGHYHQSEFSEDLQERYDAFMKYLNI